MADYPVTKIDKDGSKETWLDPFLESRARDGSVKGRRLASGRRRVFNVSHRFMTDAERDALESHYDAHRTVAFNLLWPADGVTYSVIYGGSELDFAPLKGGQWSTVVKLLQVG